MSEDYGTTTASTFDYGEGRGTNLTDPDNDESSSRDALGDAVDTSPDDDDTPGAYDDGDATGSGSTGGLPSGAVIVNNITGEVEKGDPEDLPDDTPGAFEGDQSAPGGGSSQGQGVSQDVGGASGVPSGENNFPATEDGAAYITDPSDLKNTKKVPEFKKIIAPLRPDDDGSTTLLVIAAVGALLTGVIGLVAGGSD